METIGLPELLVIGLVAVLLFGTKKLPDLGRGIGEGIKNFKASLNGTKQDIQEVKQEVQQEVERV